MLRDYFQAFNSPPHCENVPADRVLNAMPLPEITRYSVRSDARSPGRPDVAAGRALVGGHCGRGPPMAVTASASPRGIGSCCWKAMALKGDAHAGPFVRHRYLARRRPRVPNLRQVHLIRAL
jgi:hypothetical protein